MVNYDSDILSRISAVCKKEGITIKLAPLYAHEANGGAEGTGKTLIIQEMCIIIEAKLPKYF